MRSRSAAFPVRKRATCCTALEMADGAAWALIYSFGVSILRQPRGYLLATIARAKPTKASRSAGGQTRRRVLLENGELVTKREDLRLQGSAG
jgi:hypothetical protein